MKHNYMSKSQWDKVYDKFEGGRQSVWSEKADSFFLEKIGYLKHLGLKRVLDAGCGDGRNLTEFAKAGFDITGVDLSESALKKMQGVMQRLPKCKTAQTGFGKTGKARIF